MDPLLQALRDIASGPIDTLLHIGADASALTALDGVDARRVVLVQGDPDQATDLRQVAAGAPAHVQIIPRVVTPAGGPARWHRYNFGVLNGPLDASGLVRFYPRLRQAGVLSLTADAFGTVVDAVGAAAAPGGRNILVLDVPGQERALLASLTEAQRELFDTVLLRGCSDVPGDGWAPVGQTLDDMQAQCYRDEPLQVEQDALWPVHLLRFDSALHQQRLREQRLAELEAQAEAAQRQLEQLQAERSALDRSLAEQSALLEAERSDTRAAGARADQQRQELQSALERCQADLARLAADRDAQAKLAAERATRLDELQKSVEERGAIVARRDRAIQEVQRQLAERDARIAQLEQTEVQRQQLDAELATSAAARSKAEAQVKELSVVIERHRADVTRLTADRDTQARLAAERATRIDELQKTVEERGAIVARRDRALQEVQRQLEERDARIAVLEKAEVQRQQLEPQARRASQLEAELATSAAARTKAEALAKELSATLERYRADVARLTTDRDAQAKLAAEKTTQANDRNKRVIQLESELADAQRRLDLMHQELAKAGGQLELLQELLLQEPSL